MAETSHIHPDDLRGAARLATDATIGATDLVEALHLAIARPQWLFGAPADGRTGGLTGAVYASVRGVTRLVGGGVDATIAALGPLLGARPPSPERDTTIAVLNGVLGDYLAASANPLAQGMELRWQGRALDLAAIDSVAPQLGGKILLLVHGLCLNERSWSHNGHDHGALLAAELGYTPLYLRYNTGLHISVNGRMFADLLERLADAWPVPIAELAIVGHSMGGLVTRSACHDGAAAGHRWLRHLRALVFLGTPHHGAPLERRGNELHGLLGATPYTAAFARLGAIRSAGITDLRYGSLVDEDWAARDRFAPGADRRQRVPLPDGVACSTVGATTGRSAGDLRDTLLGDGLVPLASALGTHPNPDLSVPFDAANQWIGYSMSHLDLLHRRDVYERVRGWLTDN